jgi:hypothetical protein
MYRFSLFFAIRYLRRGTAAFFGVVEEGNQEEEDALKSRWLERRKRFSSKKFGSLREAYKSPSRRDGEDEVDFWRRTHSSVSTYPNHHSL